MKILKHIIITSLLAVYAFFGCGTSIFLFANFNMIFSIRNSDRFYPMLIFACLISLVGLMSLIVLIIYCRQLYLQNKATQNKAEIDEIAFTSKVKEITYKRFEIRLYALLIFVLFLLLSFSVITALRNYWYFHLKINPVMIFIQVLILLSIVLFIFDVRAFNKKRLQNKENLKVE